jgi:hypothetical protein
MIQIRTHEWVQRDLILATGSRMNDPWLTQRVGAARRWRQPHRSFALSSTEHDNSGFLAQIDAVDTRILTRRSWMAGTIPRWLAAAVTPLQALGSVKSSHRRLS